MTNTTTAVPTDAIEPGPVRRRDSAFSDEFLVRARRAYDALGDAPTFTFLDFLGDFKRDAHPENELRVWERITAAFEACTRDRDWSKERRRELLSFLSVHSMGEVSDGETASKFKHLTVNDRREAERTFASVAVPADQV